jgi:hypothetical protein
LPDKIADWGKSKEPSLNDKRRILATNHFEGPSFFQNLSASSKELPFELLEKI